ncbi:MAG TPA: hypothetical protein VII57_06040 [Dehalococcoidia bacterium]
MAFEDPDAAVLTVAPGLAAEAFGEEAEASAQVLGRLAGFEEHEQGLVGLEFAQRLGQLLPLRSEDGRRFASGVDFEAAGH